MDERRGELKRRFFFRDKSSKQGRIEKIAVDRVGTNFVLLGKDLCCRLFDFFQDMLRHYPCFTRNNSLFIKEKPHMMPLRFAAFNVGFKTIVICPCHKLN